MRKRLLLAFIGIPMLCLISIGIYNLPPVESRLAPRLDQVRTRIVYALNPPEEDDFAHVDLWTADNAIADIWPALLEWIEDH